MGHDSNHWKGGQIVKAAKADQTHIVARLQTTPALPMGKDVVGYSRGKSASQGRSLLGRFKPTGRRCAEETRAATPRA